MTFKNISYFNNFSATNFNLIPKSFEINKTLLDSYASEINKNIDTTVDKIIVFGSYHTEKLICKEIVNIDFPDNKNFDIDSYHFELLDSWAFTTENIVEYCKNSNNLFILTTEHLALLEDPRPLLLSLKKLLLFSQNKQRVILLHQDKCMGYRTWNKDELEIFLHSSGFESEICFTQDGLTIYIIDITYSSYQAYLEREGISKDLIDSYLLLLTTEDASIAPTGGIGTYIKNMKNCSSKIAVLYCDLKQEPLAEHKNTFFVKSFMADISPENYYNGVGLLENIKCILYILPNLTTIEFQDYTSWRQNHIPMGFRIVQARQTGILPNYLHLRVFLHGNIDHLRYGIQDDRSMDYSFTDLKISTMDHYIFKKVDEVFSPSYYLQSLLKDEYGYELSNLSTQRLPFDLKNFNKVPKTNISEINEIVFIGKYSRTKGWYDFVEAISILSRDKSLNNIKKITALSPREPSINESKILSEIIDFQSLHLSHNELIKYIKEQKNHTLFVAPASVENFPFVTLELLLAGALFIGYNTGGAVEVVDNEKYLDKYFCNADAASLSKKIDQLLNSELTEHNEHLNKNQLFVFNRQKNTNGNIKNIYEQKNKKTTIRNMEINNISKEISIVVPVYNTKLDYIEDLLFSINALRIAPKEVIFIDDGSEKEYLEKFTILVIKSLRNISFRIVSQSNKGLAGARNRGLDESKTKYTYFMDSDDVFIPNTLYNAWVCMQVSPNLVAASGFPLSFSERKIDNIPLSSISNGNYWKPIGHNIAKALSMKENQYIAASSLINTSAIKSFGGWDETDKSTWEDWAFYSKLAWSGYEFSLIPTIGYFYRNTPGSMSKTYNKFLGRRRLVRNIPILSKLDANVVISLINNEKSTQNKFNNLQKKYENDRTKAKQDLNKLQEKYENDINCINQGLHQANQKIQLIYASASYRIGHILLHEKRTFVNPKLLLRKLKTALKKGNKNKQNH